MTREEFYEELRLEIVERFWKTLSEEERDIIRKNTDSKYAQVVRKFLGEKILGGLPAVRSLDE